MFDIEASPTWRGTCNCCGFPMTRLDRTVRLDGRTVAHYHAEFTEHPKHPPVVMLDLTLEHTEGESGSEERLRFPITLRFHEGRDAFAVRLHEAASWPWRDTAAEKLLGKLIDRKDALAHPRIQEVYSLMNLVVENDMPIRQYLLGPAAHVEVEANAQA